MPGIALGVRNDQAQFYWHLGDFRATYDIDEDILAVPEYRNQHLAIAEYQRFEWRDFIAQQIEPFGDTPVFLAIGNHELVPPKTRADYIQQFADWLDSPVLRSQRLKDESSRSPVAHLLSLDSGWRRFCFAGQCFEGPVR